MSLKHLFSKRTFRRTIAGVIVASMAVPHVAIGVQAEEGSPVNLVQNGDFESVIMGMPEGWAPTAGTGYIQEDFEGDTSKWTLDTHDNSGIVEIVDSEADGSGKVLHMQKGANAGGAKNGRAELYLADGVQVNPNSQYRFGIRYKGAITGKAGSTARNFGFNYELFPRDDDNADAKWVKSVVEIGQFDSKDSWQEKNQEIDVAVIGRQKATSTAAKLYVVDANEGAEVYADDFYFVPVGADNGALKVTDTVEWTSGSFSVAAGDVLNCGAEVSGDGQGGMKLLFDNAAEEGQKEAFVSSQDGISGTVTVPEGAASAQVVLYQTEEGKSVQFDNVNVSVMSVEDAKTAAADRLTEKYNTYVEKQAEYSEENWGKLTKAYEDALAAIQAAGTIGEAEEAYTAGICAMAGVLTYDGEAAKTESQEKARSAIEEAFAAYDPEAYSDTNWSELERIKEQALLDIENAGTENEVEEILAAALEALASVKTELQQAQEDAIEKLESEFKDENYFSPELAELQELLEGIRATIKANSLIDVIQSIVSYAESRLGAIETKSDVLARFDITLGTNKSDILQPFMAAYEAINQDDYYENGQQELKDLFQQTENEINSALFSEEDFGGQESEEARQGVLEQKIAELEAFVKKQIQALGEVATKAEIDATLAEAKEQAIADVDGIMSGLKEEDYKGNHLDESAEPYDAWTSLTEQAGETKKWIEEAGNTEDVQRYLEEFRAAVASTKTLLEVVQEEGTANVADAFRGYSAADYYAAKADCPEEYAGNSWEELEAIYNGAVSDDGSIRSAESRDAVKAAVDQAVEAMGKIMTKAQILADVKEKQKAAVQSAYESYVPENYSESNQAALAKVKDDALAAIDRAATVEEVKETANQAIEGMKAIPTMLQEAQTAAKAELAAKYEEYKKLQYDDQESLLPDAKYADEDWQELTRIYEEAIKDVDAKDRIEDVTSAKDEALKAMAAVPQIDDRKQTLIDQVEAAFAEHKALQYGENEALLSTARYYDEQWDEIVKGKDAALEEIKAASTTVAQAKTIAENAIAAMDEVPDAKTVSAKRVTDAYAEYEPVLGAYSAENQQRLGEIRDEALAGIEGASVRAEIEEKEKKAIADMAAVPTSLQEAIAGYVLEIEAAYNGYLAIRDQYDDNGFAEIENAKNKGLIALNAAENKEEAEAVKDNILKQMEDVLTILETKQADASSKLKEMFEIYQSLNGQEAYEADAWAKIEEANQTAEQAIAGAVGVQDVESALNTGLQTMREVDTKATAELTAKYNELKGNHTYTPNDAQSLKDIYESALEFIRDAAETGNLEEMEAQKQKGIDELQRIPTASVRADWLLKLSTSVYNAQKELENLYQKNAADSPLITDENKNSIQQTVENEKTKLSDLLKSIREGLRSEDDYDKAVEDIQTTLEKALESIQQQIDAADQRVIDKDALAKEYEKYAPDNYSEEAQKELADLYQNGLDQIQKAENVAQADEALKNAAESFKGVTSLLAKAISDALEVLDQTYEERAGKDQGNKEQFAPEQWEKLQSVYEEGKNEIGKKASVQEVMDALEEYRNQIMNVPTMLEAAKNEALAEIEKAYQEKKEGGLTEADETLLEEIYEGGKQAIESESAIDMIPELKDQILNRIEEIVTILEQAVIDAKTELQNAYGEYDRNNYSSANWNVLKNIYSQAIKDLDAAESVEAVGVILEKAKNDMIVVEALVYTTGDVNGDGRVSLADASIALKIAMDVLPDASDAQISAANVVKNLNDEGNPWVDTTDVLAILQYINKIIPSLDHLGAQRTN